MKERYLNKLTSIVESNGLSRSKSTKGDSKNDSKAVDVNPANPPKEANDPASNEGVSNTVASEFFARARALSTTTHFAHLSTDSYSEHIALNTFYEDIVETIDKFCEAYIGLYGKFITLPSIPTKMQVAVDAIIEFREWINSNRDFITDDSSLNNIIDETVELCNTTVYKLQKLS